MHTKSTWNLPIFLLSRKTEKKSKPNTNRSIVQTHMDLRRTIELENRIMQWNIGTLFQEIHCHKAFNTKCSGTLIINWGNVQGWLISLSLNRNRQSHNKMPSNASTLEHLNYFTRKQAEVADRCEHGSEECARRKALKSTCSRSPKCYCEKCNKAWNKRSQSWQQESENKIEKSR